MELPQSRPPAKRCAIYVRKSSDKGLSADFTSLQAQREICSAYIASQQHKGWIELPKRYEDAGLSGATLARPAIQELLADVERGQVDIVVVYKLDRLSRSLLDFVRLLESFERCGASFVCITQNFDTADSLGRLVMNVLLTFAQFERELAGDRIRDKKRLMTARGLWSGGRAPLGYDLVAHRLIVNENEAALVRHLYERYVALRSMKAVTRECRLAGLVSKKRVEKDGRVNGGCLLSIGSVRSILRNPIYVGELKSEKGTSRGLHTAIISADLWHRVREIREAQTRQRVTSAPEDLFGGLTFDCYGRRMKPDRRYLKCGWVALYTSFQTEWARAQGLKRLRLNASSFENVVLSGFHDLLHDRPRLRSIMIELGNSLLAPAARGASISRRLRTLEHAQLRRCLHALVERIEVSRERILVQLRSDEVMRLLDWDGIGSFSRGTVGGRSKLFCLSMPCVGVARLERRLRLPIRTNTVEGSPDRRLVALIREAREAQLLADTYRGETADQLAGRLHRCTGYFMRLLRLNYLAPDIVAAVLDGNQPVTLRRKQLLNSDLPLDWTIQRQLFGFPEQPPLQTSERY